MIEAPVCGELVNTGKIFADEEVAGDRSLYVMSQRVRRFIHVVASEGSLIPIVHVVIDWEHALTWGT